MKMNQNNDVLVRVLDIINSSTRTAPAHFTSNGKRTQSFCIDFEISEADEYEMASEAWRKATDPSAVKAGEDIILAVYLATKLGGEKDIPQLQQIILKHNLPVISELQKQSEYIKQCIQFGKRLAIRSNY